MKIVIVVRVLTGNVHVEILNRRFNMCHCNPSLRTPYCGKLGCHPPIIERKTEVNVFKLFDSLEAKKQECEMLRDMLKECMEQCEYLLKTPPEEVWQSKVTDKLVGYGIYLRTGLKGED